MEEKVPMKILSTADAIPGLAAWFMNPLREVGMNTVGLSALSIGLDHASQLGCKSQSYTSWDCCSRSYVTSAVTHIEEPVPAGGRRRRDLETPLEECEFMVADQPTEDELKSMNNVERTSLTRGTRSFYRGVGLLTKKQAKQVKYLRLLRERCVHEGHRHYWRERKPTPRGEDEVDLESEGAQEDGNWSGTDELEQTEAWPSQIIRTKREMGNGRGDGEKGASQEVVFGEGDVDTEKLVEYEELGKKREEEGGPIKQNRDRTANSDSRRNRTGARKKQKPRKTPEEVLQETGGVPQEPLEVGNGIKRDYYSDTLPVSMVFGDHVRKEFEIVAPVPYSPMYTQAVERLADPASTGSLAAVVHSVNIRDSSTIVSLAKHVSKSTNTRYDVMPMARLGSLILSLDKSAVETDTIWRRYTRGVEALGPVRMNMAAREMPGEYDMVAMPLDIFVAFAEGNTDPVYDNAEFAYNGIDTEWVGVPVRSEQIGKRSLIPYVTAHVSSEMWSGRMIYERAVTYRIDPEYNNNPQTKMQVMTRSSSAYYPGPKKIILVLRDTSSSFSTDSINFRNTQVPVFRGRTLDVQQQPAVDFYSDIFTPWFEELDQEQNAVDCTNAWMEICANNGVENACKIASSVVSDIGTVLYHGMYLHPYTGKGWDYDQAAGGAWSWDGGLLSGKSRVRTNMMPKRTEEEISGRRMMVGYNFSGLTPFHKPSYSLVKTEYVPGLFPTTGDVRVWQGLAPTTGAPAYVVPVCDSVMRVAINVGLVLTNSMTMFFASGQAFSGWHCMNGLALGLVCGTALTSTEISLRVWSGMPEPGDEAYATALMHQVTKAAGGGVVQHYYLKSLVDTWIDWDEDQLVDYFGVGIADSDWLTFSPLPSHLIKQWQDKTMFAPGSWPSMNSYFRAGGVNLVAARMMDNTLGKRNECIGSIDVQRYAPTIHIRYTDSPVVRPVYWMDQWSAISLESTSRSRFGAYEMLESGTWMVAYYDGSLSYMPAIDVYVSDSVCQNMNEEYKKMRVSPIMMPDPINWSNIISGAKNWILYPAISALGGFLTGGPAGAAIAGGAHLAKNVVEHFVKDPGSQQTAKNVIGKVETTLKDAYGSEAPENVPSMDAEVAADETVNN